MFSMNVWRAWANSRNFKQETLLEKYKTVPVVLDATTKEELSFWMCRFVNEARRKDGSKYPPNTIYNIVTGIQRHLRDECKRPEINFFSLNEYIFASFRATLDAVMKERTAEGMGVVKHTENLTVDEETELWGKGVINKLTPKGLSYGGFFYNCKVFGLRGLSEHKQLQAEQFVMSKQEGRQHSGRVYCSSTLYNSCFEEQEVMQRSGHRSTAVRTYKRPSEEKLKEISNALQPPLPQTQSCDKEYTCPTPVKMRATSVNQTSFASTSQGVNGSNVLKIDLPPCIDTVIISKDGKDITLSI
ncbi:zinc finger MYM-type protein 3-like [Crassostrea virginica]